MNRLVAVTEEAKRFNEKLFCAFLTLGYPDIKTTVKLIEEFDQAGVDIIELGFPFSDPLADGPTIQYCSEQALKKGVHIEDAFKSVKSIRDKNIGIPILFFSYFNPILCYGVEKFVQKAVESGFDGFVIPDLPPDSEVAFREKIKKSDLVEVHLIAPTTNPKRSEMIAKASRGFIYYVSLRGVTGARKGIDKEVFKHLKFLKSKTETPILVGFGVSTPEQAKQLSKAAEGVIVGSAIMDCLRKSKGKTAPVVNYVKTMIQAVKSNS